MAIVEISGGTGHGHAADRRARQRITGHARLVRRHQACSPTRPRRTALVVWDHGLGWQGIAFDEDITAAGGYQRTRRHLDAAELGSAMDAGLAAAGREQLDLLVLDACLMANFEVVSEAYGNAGYLISSEELVPGLGLDYDAFAVFADPAADVATIFDTLAAGFVADIETASPIDADMMTLSVIDLDQAPNLDAGAGCASRSLRPPTSRRTRSPTSSPPARRSGTATPATAGPAMSTSAST